MMRALFLLAGTALAAAALPQATHKQMQAQFSTPSRITVITKNSEYPRLNRNGVATHGFAQGQWI